VNTGLDHVGFLVLLRPTSRQTRGRLDGVRHLQGRDTREESEDTRVCRRHDLVGGRWVKHQGTPFIALCEVEA
jgi:hypothetical protein